MAGDVRQEWTWRDIFRSIGLAFSFALSGDYLSVAGLIACCNDQTQQNHNVRKVQVPFVHLNAL